MSKLNNKVFLIILDGWGHGQDPNRSAISQANTPTMDSLYEKYPDSELVTFGSQVGLPDGQMGNSEVGHLNIGAGRIVYQDFARINKAISDNSLRDNSALRALSKYCTSKQKALHLFGLVSDGGVHSHLNHLKYLVNSFSSDGVEEIYIHAFMDGRDTSPDGGIEYLRDLSESISNTSAEISSVIGRYYAMDRDERWERIKLAYDLMVHGEGAHRTDLIAALEDSYKEGITDEFIKPIVSSSQVAKSRIKDGDAVLCFNFRTDRPRQITRALTQESFEDYDMKPLDLEYCTMTNYDVNFKNISIVLEKDNLTNTLGEYLASNGLSQLRAAETEKYPHVSFFFSGGREKAFENEARIMVNSPKVATYDLKPEMSAPELKDAIIKALDSHYDFICLNFANADMVGHTGSMPAAISAVEAVDKCLKEIMNKSMAMNYHHIIIADHGNSDIMINQDGSPHTAHTTNPVPIIYANRNVSKKSHKIHSGILADVATTILGIMNLEVPNEMTGQNLIEKLKD